MAVALSTVSFALESYVWILGPWGQGEAEETLENEAVSLGYTPPPWDPVLRMPSTNHLFHNKILMVFH